MRRSTTFLLLIIVLLSGCFVWHFVEHEVQRIQIAFAAEQTQIFEQMTDQARSAIAEGDVKSAAQFLKYTHAYYPSGSKQTEGSRLDRIVERMRTCCEREIIRMLKESTGEDIGDSPESWIEKYAT